MTSTSDDAAVDPVCWSPPRRALGFALGPDPDRGSQPHLAGNG